MKRAIFIDRDGVLNELALNPKNGEHESPHNPADLRMLPGVADAALKLERAGFALFIVSNQPSYAKGKTSLEKIRAIAQGVEAHLHAAGVTIARAYYCFHHPDGIVPEYSGPCECRKPKPKFLFDARDEFGIDLAQSWMIGDQDTDIECGRRAGCHTVGIDNPLSAHRRRGSAQPTLTARDLPDAVEKIIAFQDGAR
jgi:D-glycero-D-manno-heptose 1,7-bisphosphate phosphatase